MEAEEKRFSKIHWLTPFSVVVGGKFESGAVSGAFSALANALMNPETRQQAWGDLKNLAKNVWNLPTNIIGGTLGGISHSLALSSTQLLLYVMGLNIIKPYIAVDCLIISQ